MVYFLNSTKENQYFILSYMFDPSGMIVFFFFVFFCQSQDAARFKSSQCFFGRVQHHDSPRVFFNHPGQL